MKRIALMCPKCNNIFTYKNWFVWVLHSPFHWFGKRHTKCPHCKQKSWMGR
jgi:hypothetical protein